MTSQLQRAFEEAAKLPDDEQDVLAAWLLEEIEDRLHGAGQEPKLSDELRAELNRRAAALDADPSAATPWEVIEARALERYRK